MQAAGRGSGSDGGSASSAENNSWASIGSIVGAGPGGGAQPGRVRALSRIPAGPRGQPAGGSTSPNSSGPAASESGSPPGGSPTSVTSPLPPTFGGRPAAAAGSELFMTPPTKLAAKPAAGLGGAARFPSALTWPTPGGTPAVACGAAAGAGEDSPATPVAHLFMPQDDNSEGDGTAAARAMRPADANLGSPVDALLNSLSGTVQVCVLALCSMAAAADMPPGMAAVPAAAAGMVQPARTAAAMAADEWAAGNDDDAASMQSVGVPSLDGDAAGSAASSGCTSPVNSRLLLQPFGTVVEAGGAGGPQSPAASSSPAPAAAATPGRARGSCAYGGQEEEEQEGGLSAVAAGCDLLASLQDGFSSPTAVHLVPYAVSPASEQARPLVSAFGPAALGSPLAFGGSSSSDGSLDDSDSSASDDLPVFGKHGGPSAGAAVGIDETGDNLEADLLSHSSAATEHQEKGSVLEVDGCSDGAVSAVGADEAGQLQPQDEEATPPATAVNLLGLPPQDIFSGPTAGRLAPYTASPESEVPLVLAAAFGAVALGSPLRFSSSSSSAGSLDVGDSSAPGELPAFGKHGGPSAGAAFGGDETDDARAADTPWHSNAAMQQEEDGEGDGSVLQADGSSDGAADASAAAADEPGDLPFIASADEAGQQQEVEEAAVADATPPPAAVDVLSSLQLDVFSTPTAVRLVPYAVSPVPSSPLRAIMAAGGSSAEPDGAADARGGAGSAGDEADDPAGSIVEQLLQELIAETDAAGVTAYPPGGFSCVLLGSESLVPYDVPRASPVHTPAASPSAAVDGAREPGELEAAVGGVDGSSASAGGEVSSGREPNNEEEDVGEGGEAPLPQLLAAATAEQQPAALGIAAAGTPAAGGSPVADVGSAPARPYGADAHSAAVAGLAAETMAADDTTLRDQQAEAEVLHALHAVAPVPFGPLPLEPALPPMAAAAVAGSGGSSSGPSTPQAQRSPAGVGAGVLDGGRGANARVAWDPFTWDGSPELWRPRAAGVSAARRRATGRGMAPEAEASDGDE